VNLFYQPGIPDGNFFLEEEESRHCVKVLRKDQGDLLHLTDGEGFFYTATITKADSRKCQFVIESKTAAPTRPYHLHIAISPTKNTDRMEWFVEKCVEIGVDEISLLDCKHTERAFFKSDRLRKIAISAMKQSLKAKLPAIHELTEFSKFITQHSSNDRFIAYVDQANPLTLKEAAKNTKHGIVLIGPEGDFSQEELTLALQGGYQKVSLGPSRLRTETAGIAACHTFSLLYQ
jgi:16S rRNA (uracil1498-N3)-methyltransferase